MAWKFIELHTTDPAFNLAAEQYVFDSLPKEDNYFMLWQNGPSVIVGRHQNTLAEINVPYVEGKKLPVVRRLSGGGAVYHDLGNLNFTFVQNADSSRPDLSLFCHPVAKALRELGAPAEVNGRNDITILGQKISGNAQYVRQGRVMHHGTLLFDADLEAAGMALKPSAEKLRSKGVASVRSRMTTLREHLPQGTTLAQFRSLFLQRLFEGTPMETYVFQEEELQAIRQISDERYATRQWNYGQSPPCDLVYKGYIPQCGTVELQLSIRKGLIKEARFYGDFFAQKDLAPLCMGFVGETPDPQGFTAAVASVDPSEYIQGLSRDELLNLLLSS